MPYTYDYPRMLVTVDAVIFLHGKLNHSTKVLLIKRRNDPFSGCYALPGGFPEMDEPMIKAAARELFEETGIEGVELNPLAIFDKIDRDPRGRNIAIAFYGFASSDNSTLKAGDDAEEANWFPLDDLPELAFDHKDIILAAKQYIQ